MSTSPKQQPLSKDIYNQSASPKTQTKINEVDENLEPLEQNVGESKENSDPVTTKTCCLETRNNTITRNNIAVFLVFYFMNSLAGWVNSYNVFFIEDSLGVQKADVDDVQQINRIIGYIVQVPIVLGIGVIYDIYGRRKPFLFAWSLACLGMFVYPFNDNKFLYYLISVLMVPLTAIFTIPFVPDLIKEESQPLAIFFNIVSIASGKVVVALLLMLVANKHLGIPYQSVYIGISILSALYIVYAFFGMKDVVQSKEFKLRRSATRTEKSSSRGLYVLKQGFKLVLSTPQILFGILGLTQADLILNVSTGTTTQALIQKYTQSSCPTPVLKKCAADAESRAQAYSSKVLQLAILLGIPFAFITSKFAKSERINQVYLLYTFLILCTGINTIMVYDNIGDIPFLISDVLFATFDFGTGVICQSMIYTKLLPDSRGVIASIILLSTTLFGIIQAFLTIAVQSGYDTTSAGGKHETNFIQGGKMNVGIYVLTQFMLFIGVAIWQCKEAFAPAPKPKNGEEDSFSEVEDY